MSINSNVRESEEGRGKGREGGGARREGGGKEKGGEAVN